MHVGHQAFASTGRRSVDWPADGEYHGSGPITFLCLTPYSYRQAICLGEHSAHTQPALLSNRITEGRTMLTERKQSLTSQDWLHGPFRVSLPIDVAGTVTKWMHEMSPLCKLSVQFWRLTLYIPLVDFYTWVKLQTAPLSLLKKGRLLAADCIELHASLTKTKPRLSTVHKQWTNDICGVVAVFPWLLKK